MGGEGGGGHVWVTRYRSAEQEARSLLYILLRSTVSSGSASFIHPSTSSARAILLHQRGCLAPRTKNKYLPKH